MQVLDINTCCIVIKMPSQGLLKIKKCRGHGLFGPYSSYITDLCIRIVKSTYFLVLSGTASQPDHFVVPYPPQHTRMYMNVWWFDQTKLLSVQDGKHEHY